MNVYKTESGNEEVNKVKRVLIYLRAILCWGDYSGSKSSKSRDELAKNEVHQRQKGASCNCRSKRDNVERPAFAIRITEDALFQYQLLDPLSCGA